MDQLEPKKFRLPSTNGFFQSVVDDIDLDDDDENDDEFGNNIVKPYDGRKNAYQPDKDKNKARSDGQTDGWKWREKEINDNNSIFGSIGTLNSLTGG